MSRPLPEYITPVYGTPATHEVFVTATALAVTPDPTPTQEIATTCFYRGMVRATLLNIRETNATDATILGTLRLGDVVWFYPFRASDSYGGWDWIQLKQGGWVAGNYVTPLEGC